MRVPRGQARNPVAPLFATSTSPSESEAAFIRDGLSRDGLSRDGGSPASRQPRRATDSLFGSLHRTVKNSLSGGRWARGGYLPDGPIEEEEDEPEYEERGRGRGLRSNRNEWTSMQGTVHTIALDSSRRSLGLDRDGGLDSSGDADNDDNDRNLLSLSERSDYGGADQPGPSTHQTEKKDNAWTAIYALSMAAMFATTLMVYLDTDAPDSKHPIGDTIYTVLHMAYPFLVWSMVFSAVVGGVWVYLLRTRARQLAYVLAIAVPVVLTSFSLYGFVASFRENRPQQGFQNTVLRLVSVGIFLAGVFWAVVIVKARNALRKAVEIFEFAVRRTDEYSLLVLIGFVTMVVSMVWTWVWLNAFARVFLVGQYSSVKEMFVINPGSWALGLLFLIVYGWTNGIIFGLQRAIVAGTMSYWYFFPRESKQVTQWNTIQFVRADLVENRLGTIIFSSFLNVTVRFLLAVLPTRLQGVFILLVSRLTMLYSVIRPCSLQTGAHDIVELQALNPSVLWSSHGGQMAGIGLFSYSSTPFGLAETLLRGVRYMVSGSIGLVGWVVASTKMMSGDDGGAVLAPVRGSLYGYMVGCAAATMGWYVLGSIEGTISGVMDGLLICWAVDEGGKVGSANVSVETREHLSYLFSGSRGGGSGSGRGRGRESPDEEEWPREDSEGQFVEAELGARSQDFRTPWFGDSGVRRDGV